MGKDYFVWSLLSFPNLKCACMYFAKFETFGGIIFSAPISFYPYGTPVIWVLNLLILFIRFLRFCSFFAILLPLCSSFRLYNFYWFVIKFIDFLAFSILLSPSSKLFISDIFSILKFVFVFSSSFYSSAVNLHISIIFKSVFTLPHGAWL